MEYINLILLLVVLGVLYGIYEAAKNWVARIPERVHEKNVEELKNALEKELSRFQITEENLYIKKVEAFELFQKSVEQMVVNVKSQKQQEQKKSLEESQRYMSDFFGKAIFYCDEETFKRVLAYRRFSNKINQQRDPSTLDKAKMIMVMADIFLSMRKSLGYEDELGRESFLYLILNDWDDMKVQSDYKEALDYKFEEYY